MYKHKSDIMFCPNCNKNMMYQSGTGNNPDISEIFYDIDDDDPECEWYRYTCSACKIKYTSAFGWEIPKKYTPTEKQKNTIQFINSRFDLSLEALTKHQAWQDINKYFDKAKKAKGISPWSQNPDDYIGREIEVEYEIETENDMDLF